MYINVDVSQWREIVKDIEAATEGRDHKVVFALLDDDVTNRNRRHAAFELRPVTASIQREEQAELGACKEKLRIDWILSDGKDDSVLR